jgi:STE24 endopeptidase
VTISTYRTVPNDPADWFSQDELARARTYQRPLTRLRLLRGALALTMITVFILTKAGPRLVDALDITGWVAQLLVIALALQLLTLLYDPWLDAWVDLVHDRKWGLSTQTGRGLLIDETKSFLLSFVVTSILLVPLYAIIRATSLWWFWGWLVVVLFSVVLGFLFPVVIAPIFNRFTPLEEGELLDRIRQVAAQAGAAISGAFVADESKRSRRDNAYVAGLGRTRRVVLYDTLLEHPVDVVEQVVAHEIGHWRLRHLSRQIPFAAALALVVFVGLDALSRWDWLLERAGVDSFRDPASLPVFLLGAQVLFTVTGLASSWLSRAFERQADLHALELLRRPDRLVDMHRRLHVKNLADLDPGLVARLRATHPPAAERMAFAAEWASEAGIASNSGAVHLPFT